MEDFDLRQADLLPSDYVPMTTYWLRRNGYPVGISKLRHRLNEALLNRGGHIGFCIRPSERRKGMAKEILSQTLRSAHRMGIEKVLLTCDIENEPSWKTIEKCGGRLEKLANGESYYWIETRGIT